MCARQGQLGVANRVNADRRELETSSSFRCKEPRWQGMGRGDKEDDKEALEETGKEAETHGVGQVSMITPNDQGVPDVGCPRALSCGPPSHVGSPLRCSPFAPEKEAVWFLEGECRCQHQGREVVPLRICVSASHPVRCLVNARQVFPSLPSPP